MPNQPLTDGDYGEYIQKQTFREKRESVISNNIQYSLVSIQKNNGKQHLYTSSDTY